MNFCSQVIQPTLEILERSTSTGWNIKTPLFPGLASLESSRFRQMLRPLVPLILPALSGSVRKTAEYQCLVNQGINACALERYRLAHGFYPSSLDGLIPEYLTALPKETTTGQPMHYRLTDPDHFLLWAPGWNLQTLDGKPGEYKGEGDIVWDQPISNKERPNPTTK